MCQNEVKWVNVVKLSNTTFLVGKFYIRGWKVVKMYMKMLQNRYVWVELSIGQFPIRYRYQETRYRYDTDTGISEREYRVSWYGIGIVPITSHDACTHSTCPDAASYRFAGHVVPVRPRSASVRDIPNKTHDCYCGAHLRKKFAQKLQKKYISTHHQQSIAAPSVADIRARTWWRGCDGGGPGRRLRLRKQ